MNLMSLFAKRTVHLAVGIAIVFYDKRTQGRHDY